MPVMGGAEMKPPQHVPHRFTTAAISTAAVLLLIVFIADGTVSYRAIQTVLRNEALVAHSDLVLRELGATLSSAKDAESGQRGYLLTNRPAYLRPYTRAVIQLGEHIGHLRRLTADNPRQQQLLRQVEQNANLKLAELRDTIVAHDAFGSAAAAAIVLSDRGKNIMDALRANLDAMGAEENRINQQRASESAASGRRALGTLLVSTLLATVVLAIMFLQIVRSALAEQGARLRAEVAFGVEQKARTEAESLARAKDEFIATLSHELRTPLTSILGWSRILRDGGCDEETIALAAESIGQSAQSQQFLIEELLDVSRIILGKFHMEISPVDLNPIGQAAADMIRPIAEAKGIEVRLELPRQPCVTNGDGRRIKQVIWNFLNNAIKFTPAGGHVLLRIAIASSWITIEVSDSGEGIDPELIPHLFERFRQADGAMAKGGLGLGLSIARHVVEAHGGSVSAISDGKGKGATFVARLPMGTKPEPL
jgi:signal transduction histidine kinase